MKKVLLLIVVIGLIVIIYEKGIDTGGSRPITFNNVQKTMLNG